MGKRKQFVKESKKTEQVAFQRCSEEESKGNDGQSRSQSSIKAHCYTFCEIAGIKIPAHK